MTFINIINNNINTNKIFYICLFFLIIILIFKFYKNIDYYGKIIKNAQIPDFTRWILSDKYIAKEYAIIWF